TITHLHDEILRDGDPYDALNIQCAFIYGKKEFKGKKDEEDDKRAGKEDTILYRHPSVIFSIYGKNIKIDEGSNANDVVREMLLDITPIISVMGDEKGESSVIGVDRLFYMPYPDTTKMPLNPMLFIKGANRMRYQE
ncbi:MAG: hypothetical protein QXL15_01665, partial [Candidatus Korarchaeota archaeon]